MFVREIQKTKRSLIVLSLLLLAASLRSSWVYLCVQFAFCAAVFHFLVGWIKVVKSLFGLKAFIDPPCTSFVRTILNLDQIFFVHWQIKASFSITIMESYTPESNCSGQWRRKSTSDGSPLFAEPLFPFGWVLCNTSTYCMLTFWLSCAWIILCVISPQTLTRYFYIRIVLAIWLLPRVNLSLKNLRPYYTHKNQRSHKMNVPLTYL